MAAKTKTIANATKTTKVPATAGRCEFVGCKAEAVWEATKLFGKGGTICTCDKHRPGGNPSSNPKIAALVAARPFYEVRPIG